MKKLRILCLHGYHGSAGILRSQMAPLAAGLGSLAEFVYIDAPSLADGDFGWWHAVAKGNVADEEDPGVGPGAKYYKGWQRTRDGIVSVFAKQGPFDGVFGFSQGAALTALLVGLRAPDGKTTQAKPLAFDFAMMAGCFVSIDSNLAKLYNERESYDPPSVHIMGRSDYIVPIENSAKVASKFSNPIVLEHEGGHVIASTPKIRKRITVFLEGMLRRKSALSGSGPMGSDLGAREPMSFSQPIEVSLWPNRAHPSMRVVFPKGAGSKPVASTPVASTARPALLVFRGGAYSSCMGSGGGSAEWIAEQGMVGIRVEYGTRSTGESYPANYSDAARAMRIVRSRTAEWGIDAKRIGVMGFSAGGHLASLLSTRPELYKNPSDDLAATVSARPDLVVLAYPVISFVYGYSPGAFVSSAENFFGRRDLSDSLRREFSNELHVDAKHPPVFIWTTQDDGLVPYTHSKLFAEACKRAKVPVAYKLYPHGPHGMGLALGQAGEVSQWTSLLLGWMRDRWGAW